MMYTDKITGWFPHLSLTLNKTKYYKYTNGNRIT